MKKNFTIIAGILLVLAKASFAKTEGSYIGLDILKTKADTKTSQITSFKNIDYINSASNDSSFGFGINSKYAFNFNNFYVAPGVLFQFPNNESEVDDKKNLWQQSLSINSRFALKSDFGYDFNKVFSVYIPLGYNSFNLSLKTNDYINNGSYVKAETRGNAGSFFYGLGFNVNATDKLSFNLEYNKTSIDFDSKTSTVVFSMVPAKIKTKTDIDIIKAGIAYHF